MAFIIDYEDHYNDLYPASYWIPVRVDLCKTTLTGAAVFLQARFRTGGDPDPACVVH